MSNLSMMEDELGQRQQSHADRVRLGAQVFGAILVLIGTWFAVLILRSCIGVLEDPGKTATPVASMSRVMGLEGVQIPVGKDQIPIGRTAGEVLLLVWYILASSIALKFVTIGGRMVVSVIAERKEVLAITRELMAQTRNQK
jgi:hypothetical protein